MEDVRPDPALSARRRAAFGVADVLLGIAWTAVIKQVDLAPWATLALTVAAQALVLWGLTECVRAWRDLGVAGKLFVGLIAGVALLELGMTVVASLSAAGWV
jgi:hypothetical protein